MLYYGVLGARSAWRARLRTPEAEMPVGAGWPETAVASSSHRPAGIASPTNQLWAQLMQRSFGFDVLACPRCGDRLELIALIEAPTVIRRILSHLGLPTDVPAARPARPPPLPIGRLDSLYDDIAVTRIDGLRPRAAVVDAPGAVCTAARLTGAYGGRDDPRRVLGGNPRCARGVVGGYGRIA